MRAARKRVRTPTLTSWARLRAMWRVLDPVKGAWLDAVFHDLVNRGAK